jgi:hypothetical protein
MRGLSETIVSWWNWFTSWFRKPEVPRTTNLVVELPETLDASVVYVLGEGDHRWFVAMVCPCGCGATLEMSLLNDAKPKWRMVEHHDGTISIQPSVWRKVGCKSHFFLRRGLVVWCQ